MKQVENKRFKSNTSSCMKSKKRCVTRHPKVEVVDLFCGIGGLSYGMKTAGFNILAGYDLDWTCQYAYETNTGGKFFYKDVKSVTGDEINKLYSKKKNTIRVLAGCAPCQPFSSYAHTNKHKDENKYNLLYEFGRLVKEVQPDIVTMENVPAIAAFKLKSVLGDFVKALQDEDYHVRYQVVYCPDYGIPQTRKRLVLLASRLGDIQLISSTHKKEEYVTVRDTIGSLPPLKAGESCPTDPLHRCTAQCAEVEDKDELVDNGDAAHRLRPDLTDHDVVQHRDEVRDDILDQDRHQNGKYPSIEIPVPDIPLHFL